MGGGGGGGDITRFYCICEIVYFDLHLDFQTLL